MSSHQESTCFCVSFTRQALIAGPHFIWPAGLPGGQLVGSTDCLAACLIGCLDGGMAGFPCQQKRPNSHGGLEGGYEKGGTEKGKR